ncbi:MAG: DUF4189 domain-containing protein [Desulfuromonadaceae bacterium]|nr:DUF4189 domain-containing protein [Desulfuromonadaceae bacterium]
MKKLNFLSLVAPVIYFALFPQPSFGQGAIAVSEKVDAAPPIFAIVVGHNNAASAENAALDKCISNGGKKCSVVLNFEKCGAIANSTSSYGVGSGTTGRIARNHALRSCGDDCRVVEYQCED